MNYNVDDSMGKVLESGERMEHELRRKQVTAKQAAGNGVEMAYQLRTEDSEEIVKNILDIGEILLTSGAEVSRVEDTVQRISNAYGFARTDIFTITSSIVYSVELASGRVITQTRRIMEASDDMEKVERINALSRKICADPIDSVELKECIIDIKHSRTYPSWVVLIAHILIAVSFTIFYGGTISDAIASMIAAVVLFTVVYLGKMLHVQKMVLIILSSFLTGMAVVILIRTGIGHSFDTIVIGNIMLLIPGKAFTNSFRDIIKGDIISGSLGLLEAVFRASGIALGFAIVIILKGTI